MCFLGKLLCIEQNSNYLDYFACLKPAGLKMKHIFCLQLRTSRFQSLLMNLINLSSVPFDINVNDRIQEKYTDIAFEMTRLLPIYEFSIRCLGCVCRGQEYLGWWWALLHPDYQFLHVNFCYFFKFCVYNKVMTSTLWEYGKVMESKVHGLTIHK